MTSKEFRSAVFAEIAAWGAANFSTMPIIYENGPVPDEAVIGPIWLDVEIRWYGGSIAAMGVTPRTRDTGSVALMCHYRAAEGTGLSDDVIDSLSDLLKPKRIGSAVLSARQRTVPNEFQGWYTTGIMVPFTLG